MSFKILIILQILIITSCGVKKAPSPPADSIVPSFFDDYTFETEIEEKEVKEKSKNE